MPIKILFFIILFCISCTSYAQIPNISYQEKIDNYIERYSYDSLKLIRIQNKVQNLLGKYSSPENKIILRYFSSQIDKYLDNIASQGTHIQTPENVKSLYYSASNASNSKKIDSFITLAEKSEINALIIDIKETDGYTSFSFPEESFSVIQASSNNRIKDISSIIEKLHKNNIYIIGRVVVFKDKLLSENHPELTIKWSYNHDKIWRDYKGNSYGDPYSQEVWKYHVELASAAYKMGFDEINFDYVRFPTDGKISQTYYPFASEILEENPKWGKMQVMEKFSYSITSQLKQLHPNIILSADVFGLATHTNLFQIGQNIETFIPYFDFVAPMIYPSHYGKGYLGFNVPDNAPYEIFLDSMKQAKSRVDALNNEIKLAQAENRPVMLPGNISASQEDMQIIEFSKMRPWLQAFHCSWCQGATYYDRSKFREQIRALNEYGLDSWYVWNASGRYEDNWYDKD